MSKIKLTITIDSELIAETDRLVAQRAFRNRSEAIEKAIRESLPRLKYARLARESAKLDPREEKAMADEF